LSSGGERTEQVSSSIAGRASDQRVTGSAAIRSRSARPWNFSFDLSAEAGSARRAEKAPREQWGEALARIVGGTLERAVEQVVAFVDAPPT
jgi:hypothetical protein